MTDVGARLVADGLRAHPRLRDVGLTLADMTDAGCAALADALHTCPRLRFVFVYTSGMHAAVHVTADAQTALRAALPVHANARFDYRFSVYTKHAE